MRLLCEDTITETEIKIADAMLQSYTKLIPSLFGNVEAIYDSRSLTRLAEQARNHGPLIFHSAFVFESMLARLKRLFHGNRGIPDQIIRKLSVAQHATEHIFKNVQNNPTVKEIAENLIKPATSKSGIELNGDIKFIAAFQQHLPEVQQRI